MRLATFRLDHPLFFGAASGLAIVLAIIAVSGIASASIGMGIEMYLSNGIFTYLVPLSVAVQMGLFKHYRNSTRAVAVPIAERLGVSGSVLPSLAMMACCVCCVTPFIAALPALGFLLAAASFIAQYKFIILTLAVMANAAGSVLIYRAILRHKKNVLPVVPCSYYTCLLIMRLTYSPSVSDTKTQNHF